MRPGEVVQVVKGAHQGKQAKINASDGYFFHVQLLTESGHKQPDGLVDLHRTAIRPLETHS